VLQKLEGNKMKKFIMLSLLFIPMVVLAADETALQGFDELL